MRRVDAYGAIGRADRDTAILRNLARDVTNALDVQIAMLAREAELARQILANDVAVQQADRPTASLHELDHERVRDRRFAGTRQAREKHRETLLVARRMRAPQFGNDFREREPLGNLEAFGEPAPQLGAGDVEHVIFVDVASTGTYWARFSA